MKKQTKHIKQKLWSAFLGLSLLTFTTVAQTPATNTVSPLLAAHYFSLFEWRWEFTNV